MGKPREMERGRAVRRRYDHKGELPPEKTTPVRTAVTSPDRRAFLPAVIGMADRAGLQ